MYLKKLMEEQNMTRADLSRLSEVPDSTLRDILNGKAQMDRCEAGTLFNIAEALGTTVDEILHHYWREFLEDDDFDDNPKYEYVHDSHTLLTFYDLVDCVIEARKHCNEFSLSVYIIKEHMIEKLYDLGCFRAAFFLLGLVDYIGRKYGMMKAHCFDIYRTYCLDYPVYALSTLEEYDDIDELNEARAYAEAYAIPELAAFNIFMTEEDISPDDD